MAVKEPEESPISAIQSDQDQGECRRCDRSVTSMLINALLVGVLVFYTSSYYFLSRRGMNEAATYGMDGFLYVPAADVFATENLSGHHSRCRIYAPLNWLDRTMFGGPTPVTGIMFRLS
jgi:hypothetical protein